MALAPMGLLWFSAHRFVSCKEELKSLFQSMPVSLTKEDFFL